MAGFFEGYAEGMKPATALALKAAELRRNEEALTLKTKLEGQKQQMETLKFLNEVKNTQQKETLTALDHAEKLATETGNQALFDQVTQKKNQIFGFGSMGMNPEVQSGPYVPPGAPVFPMPKTKLEDQSALEALKAQYREVPVEKEAYRLWKAANPNGDPLEFLKTLKQSTTVRLPEQGKWTVHPTAQGLIRVNNADGNYEFIKDQGKPLLPVSADVGLAGAKKGATEEAERVSKLRTSLPKARGAMASLESQWNNVDATIDKALKQVGPFTTGAGSYLSIIPATSAKDLKANLETIRANIGFDKLQDMRNNSPTGGALGQVSDTENRLLQAVQGSLAQDQSPKQLKENLNTIKTLLGELKAKQRSAFERDFREVQKQEVEPRLPGESMDEYLKRTGQ